MNTLELKSNFHHLIDDFSNDNVLAKFYELLLKAKATKENQLWSRLTFEEQEELKLIEKESQNPENVIPHSEIQNKHKKWL